MMIAQMFRFGLTEKELEILVKVNPAKLLKLITPEPIVNSEGI